MHGPINVKSPNNTSKWQMGFNSAFKGLISKMLKMNRTDIIKKIVTTTPLGFTLNRKGITAFQIKLRPSVLKLLLFKWLEQRNISKECWPDYVKSILC
jgi:hypothetical protein